MTYPTAERNARIYADWKDGATLAMLAEKYGRSIGRMSQVVRREYRRRVPEGKRNHTKNGRMAPKRDET